MESGGLAGRSTYVECAERGRENGGSDNGERLNEDGRGEER
jgi:hypothetical protein